MKDKKKLVAIAAASAATVFARALGNARRRSRLEEAKARESFAETVMPMVSADIEPQVASPVMDEAHAPGHRHLRWSKEIAEEPEPSMVRSRPFSKRQRGTLHPGRG